MIDTDVFSADILPWEPSRLAERYAPVIAGRPAFISFQTVMELRYGALRRGWGSARVLRLEAAIQRAQSEPTDGLVSVIFGGRSGAVSGNLGGVCPR